MRRAQGIVQLDAVDKQLLQFVAADPRMSNVALADAIGVTDETVAARLKKLLDVGALAMTALIDWEVAGFGAHAYAQITTSGGPPGRVLAPLASATGAHVVAVTTGACDAIVGLLARDLVELRHQFVEAVGAVPEITSASLAIVTEACRHDLHATTLPLAGWSRTLLEGSRVPLDDLDVRLVDLLVSNAHESNRWLARQLDVSDGTVRARLRRLEEVGLLRIAAVSDTVTVGEVGAGAYVFLDVVGDDRQVVDAMTRHPCVGTVDRTVGDASVVLFVYAATENDLHSFVTGELRVLQGVARVQVAFVVETLRHVANLVRLL